MIENDTAGGKRSINKHGSLTKNKDGEQVAWFRIKIVTYFSQVLQSGV